MKDQHERVTLRWTWCVPTQEDEANDRTGLQKQT